MKHRTQPVPAFSPGPVAPGRHHQVAKKKIRKLESGFKSARNFLAARGRAVDRELRHQKGPPDGCRGEPIRVREPSAVISRSGRFNACRPTPSHSGTRGEAGRVAGLSLLPIIFR
jgi:hypothetical protein